MTEAEAIVRIAIELRNIRNILAVINMALWFILCCKRCYSYTDGIKDAIKELTRLIKAEKWDE